MLCMPKNPTASFVKKTATTRSIGFKSVTSNIKSKPPTFVRSVRQVSTLRKQTNLPRHLGDIMNDKNI